ncbi:hydantoinase B/oxoprolinase family protein [Pseudooceanicola aestuarii]|uniref:hydantoinase B/oxoprolinase family protein n=1 Tax=Pseudooceanicola aestuarii TaxID=2697319 RepID=UPI0013D0AF56|nr:hydantoinase B/oxoprolinase family protein [Pseudooceanicola aestuarii]
MSAQNTPAPPRPAAALPEGRTASATGAARDGLAAIQQQVLWSRLVAIADEIATTLVRTAFSLVVRDNHDYACSIYDARGQMLAQSMQCTPGQAGSTPMVLRDLLAVYPPETLAEGDVLISNDPWIGAGHAPDVFIATPVFRNGVLVGFTCTCAHHADMGGRLGATDARDVYEEGLIIPVTKLVSAGVEDEALVRLIRRNVRMSEKILGDIRAQMAANRVGAAGILRMMDEFDLTSLEPLADRVTAHSEAAFRAAIGRLPQGETVNEVFHELTDDAGDPIRIRVALKILEDRVQLDFTGTSPQVAKPINAVLNITRAYCVFPFIATLCPDLPMNAGAFRPVEISVPEGSVLNPTYPAPGMYRSLLSYFTVEAIMGALRKIAPDKVMAPSGTYPLWIQKFAGTGLDGRPFVTHYNAQGGQGAFRDRDGNTAVVFPGNIASTSVELFEHDGPFLVERRMLVPDTGGAGRFRGGLGQETVLRVLADAPVRSALSGGRLVEPAKGMEEGAPGGLGHISVNDGAPFRTAGRADLRQGDRVRLVQPGGGGFGPPSERAPEAIQRDLDEGYVTPEGVARDYGVPLVPAAE